LSTLHLSVFFLLIPPPPISTLFPYTTLFRSSGGQQDQTDHHVHDGVCALSCLVAHAGASLDTPEITVAAPSRSLSIFAWYDLTRTDEHTSELQSPCNLVCRLLLEKKKTTTTY